MLMSSPALPNVTSSFSSLVFFYDPIHKQVQFSNFSPQLFFGSPVNMENEFPFSSLSDGKDALDIDREWQTCLQLREEQSHDFWFQKKLGDETGIIFHFHATGVRMENEGAPSLSILFSAEKTAAGKDAAWMIELNRLRTTLDRYKTEYAEFIDIAAHNLDAPLRKLSVLVDRVTAKYGDSKDVEAQGYVNRVRNCISDMRALIDSLATLSRITSGATKPMHCNMQLIVEQQLQELRAMVHETKATITTKHLPIIEGDPSQYSELISQLLHNSLRFTRPGAPPETHIRGSVATEKEKRIHGLAPEQEYYKIEIKDNGIGFRQEYAEKIFRPFFRLHGKSEYPGNGIGLALCKRIVDNHRGIIYAEGVENEGSRFVLLLPQTLN
jgi:signal transduction histidine kinase